METIVLADVQLLQWLNLQGNSLLDAIFRLVTWAGSLYLLFPATVVLVIVLCQQGKQREGQLLALSMVGAVFFAHAAKLFFRRPRPEISEGIIPMPADWSFPSAHATQIATFCLCVGLIAVRNFPVRWAWLTVLPAVALTAGVGFSRIYLQVHYPSDVLAGMVLAMGIVGIADLLSKA